MAESEVNFCPRCGARTTPAIRFGKIHKVCTQCSWIHFNDPKVAAAMLIEEGDRVLLVRRVNEPYRGYWTLPAGFIDSGEDPAKAAERECLEETGLKARALHVLDVIAGKEHPGGADFLIVYEGEVTGGEQSPGDDADAVAWFSYDNLPNLAFDATKKTLDLHRRAEI
jgi:8-oxo-dGTP diphosphatase